MSVSELTSSKIRTIILETDKNLPSSRQSYNLFNEGYTIKEISAGRNLGESTISNHLAEFVLTGELPVRRLVSEETINELTPYILAAIAEDNLKLGPIKETVDKRFSYDDIRFVMNHLLYSMKK